jgi:hypothetical protein
MIKLREGDHVFVIEHIDSNKNKTLTPVRLLEKRASPLNPDRDTWIAGSALDEFVQFHVEVDPALNEKIFNLIDPGGTWNGRLWENDDPDDDFAEDESY